MPIFSEAEKAEFLAASPANQQAAIAANGLTAADLAQNFNIPVAVADQWATNNGINFATPAPTPAPTNNPFTQQPAAIQNVVNNAVAQSAAAPAASGTSPIDVFKHDFKIDAGGTLTVDGKPLTDAQNAESSTPGTLGWAAAFMTNPAYANFVPMVKQQLAATGTLTPQLATQIARTGNPNPDDSPFMKAIITAGMFAPLALGIGAGGLAGENLLSSGASGGVTGLTADGLTIGNAPGINAPGAGFLNTAAGSTTSGLLGSGGVFGSGVGINLSAGQIFAAEQALGTAGKALLQLALSKSNTGIATQIIAQAAAGAALSAADSRNFQTAIDQGKTDVKTIDTNAGTGTNNNTFNGVSNFGQDVTGADGTKINGDGVTTGNPAGGDLSNWGTQVNTADPAHLNNGQANPNWTDQYSTLPAGMLPYGKQVNLSNSKVLNDGTPNPAYTTTTTTTPPPPTTTTTPPPGSTSGLNLGAGSIPLALGAAGAALSLMKPEVQTKTTAAMSPEEQQLIALNTELTQKQLGNVNAATGLQGQANSAAGQALATTQANDTAISGALSPQELATQAQQQYDRAQAAGANSDTLQAINTQIAQSGGAPTAEQVARIKDAADSAISAGSSDINMQLQRGIGVIADEQANQRGLRFSTDTPILREGTLLARSAQDNIANLSANVRAGQANNMLSYPLQANASTSGVASNQQQINQAAQQFQADLVQKAQANRLALTGQATQGGIGLSGIGGNSAAIGALSNNQQANTTTTTTPGIGLTQIGQLASGVGGLVTALNQP